MHVNSTRLVGERHAVFSFELAGIARRKHARTKNESDGQGWYDRFRGLLFQGLQLCEVVSEETEVESMWWLGQSGRSGRTFVFSQEYRIQLATQRAVNHIAKMIRGEWALLIGLYFSRLEFMNRGRFHRICFIPMTREKTESQ